MLGVTKRHWLTFGLATIVLVGGILAGLHFYLLDGLDGWFFSRTFEEDTVYAPGYSEVSFRRVKLHMSMDEVATLLGPPLVAGEINGETSWAYSRSPGDQSWRVRTVIFTGGTVTEVITEFYVD